MFEFKLPDLGEGIHEAEILQWHVEMGGTAREDESLVDVETDKATVTIPSPVTGILTTRVGEPGDTVHVEQVIAVFGGAAGEPAGPVDAAESEGDRAERMAQRAETSKAEPHRGTGPVPAAPATRRLARELGVDIRTVPLSDPGGRVTDDAVRAAAAGSSEPARRPGTEEPQSESRRGLSTGSPGSLIPLYELPLLPDFSRFGEVERKPLRSIRRKIARSMVVSNVVAPRVGHAVEVDVTELEHLRREQNRVLPDGESKLTLLAFIARAVTTALRHWPQLNASLDPEAGEIIFKEYYNIGLAVAAERGLIVPVLKGADRLSVRALSAEIQRLARAVREDSLAVDELQGGTFTITNIGPLGGVPVAPMINYPEVAILGMGEVEEKAVARAGQVVVRTMLPLVVMFDHRVADGADAARFMALLKGMLGDPARFLLEV